MRSLYKPDLCFTSLETNSADELIELLAGALHKQGLVRDSFARAVRKREATSPTGLPLARRKVAVPHADPEHVIAPGVAVATLARPVAFGEMGNPESYLDVDVVLMLALRDRDSVQKELVRLVETFQNPDFVDRIHAAADPQQLFKLIASGEADR
jgi:PTS system galactitol-specific IIA component